MVSLHLCRTASTIYKNEPNQMPPASSNFDTCILSHLLPFSSFLPSNQNTTRVELYVELVARRVGPELYFLLPICFFRTAKYGGWKHVQPVASHRLPCSLTRFYFLYPSVAFTLNVFFFTFFLSQY